MSKKIWMLSILSLALVASIAGAAIVSANNYSTSNPEPQATLTGDWTANPVKDDSKINLQFSRGKSDRAGKHEIGQTYEWSDVNGLTREQAISGGPVRFSLTREAGTIECEGSFQNRKGSGTFRFTANPGFVAAMKTRGFDFEDDSKTLGDHNSEDRLFSAAAMNVTTALADDLLSANFGKLDVGDLFKAAIFKIDSAFMREMKATGFPNLDMGDLVKARIFKIDAQFVRDAAQMGFEKQSFETLVKMSLFKVTPKFVSEVRSEGLNELSIEDVVKLRIFNIDAEFIRKAKADGVPLNVENLVERRIGVRRASRRVI